MYYRYNWYHHMMLKKEREEIENCFKEQNYFTFIELYKQYNAKGLFSGFYSEEFETFFPMIYFPDCIYVYETKESIKPIDCINVLDKKNFLKINSVEYECG